MDTLLSSLDFGMNELAFCRVLPNKKEPADKNGYKTCRTNFDVSGVLKTGFNVGLPLAVNRLIAIDMDVDPTKGYDGISVIAELEKTLGKLPQTYTQRTPRGGLHKVFLAPPNTEQPKGKIGKSVDVKYNGYILFAGSSINGRYYQAIDGVAEDGRLIFAVLPDSWANYIEPVKRAPMEFKIPKINIDRKVIDGDFGKMYENCPFVQRCVNQADILSEPEWHTFACLLNSLSNGEELFDEFSQPHKGYDPVLTQEKFRKAKKYNVNCQTISRVSDACMICKYKNNEREIENGRNQ